MTKSITATKCFAPQHLPEGEPSSSWDLATLEQYAQRQDQALIAREQGLAADYWLLGTALRLLRKQFQHGQWCRYLTSLGIDRTRACKAMAIAQTFVAPEETASLNVAEAYSQRRRRTRREQAAQMDETSENSPVESLERGLADVGAQLQRQTAALPQLSPPQARTLLALARDAADRLAQLTRYFEQAALQDGFEDDVVSAVLGGTALRDDR